MELRGIQLTRVCILEFCVFPLLGGMCYCQAEVVGLLIDGSAFFGDLFVEVEQVPILVYLSIQCNTINTAIFLLLINHKNAIKSMKIQPSLSFVNLNATTSLFLTTDAINMQLYQFYRFIAPTMRTVSSFMATPQFSSQKHRKPSQYEFYNNQYKKRQASLMDMYSIRLNETPHKEVIQTNRRHKSQQHHKSSKDTIIINNNGLFHVGKTIDSINHYAEQLKQTLLKQYKAHKMRTIRNKRGKNSEEPLTSPTQFQAIEEAIEGKEDKGSKEGTKDHAYKTLNLLYKTIIDNSFRSRDKDQFQLQAVRLPMVDRFNNRMQTIKLEREQHIKCKAELPKRTEHSLPHVKIDTFPHFHKKQPQKTQSPTPDEQIVPWTTNELE